jgi:hypothetical protein
LNLRDAKSKPLNLTTEYPGERIAARSSSRLTSTMAIDFAIEIDFAIATPCEAMSFPIS